MLQPALLKLAGIGILLTIVVFKYISMSNEIAVTELALVGANKEINMVNLKLTTVQENNVTLVESLELMSAKYDSYKLSAASAKKRLITWKKQSDKEKYQKITKLTSSDTISYDKATCEEGLSLNKTISSIAYSEL